MVRKLLLFVGVLTLSCSSFAQAFFKLEADEAVTLSNLSRNGKYALGGVEGVAFMYDRTAKQMQFLEGSYYIDGVSDNGIYVGSETIETTVGNKSVQTTLPAYYKDGECMQLPMPAGSKYTDGNARSITADASMIVGYVSLSGDVGRVPCIWNMQPDGSYVAQFLPTYEKDFTDRKPQGVDALRCSASGDLVVGRMVDWTGYFNLLLTWSKPDGQNWELKELGKDIVFKEGSVFPSIPDPDEVNAMDYYTPQDSATYKKAMEDYEAGLINDNPSWYKESYITNPDSIAAYNAAAEEYNAIMEIVWEKTMQLYECATDKSIDAFSVSMSGNGNYVGTVCSWMDPEGGGDGPVPLMKGAKADGVINAPLCFDLKAGTWSIKDFVKDGITDGITNNGDIFFATPYMERTRTSFVIPAGTQNIIDVAEWVKEKTKGVVDLRSEFTFSYEYVDMFGELVVVNDSLILGDVVPSENGRVLMGTFYSPVAPEIVTYFVNMDDPSSIENSTAVNGDVAVYPNPATDMIYIKGSVEGVSVADLSGRTVYESSGITGSIPVDMLSEGMYLVKVKAAGKTVTHKIFVKK